MVLVFLLTVGLENCDIIMTLMFLLSVNLCEERRKTRQVDAQLKVKSTQSENTGEEHCLLFNSIS